MFSKHRLEALSDGVFAIAMTLLVLDIKVPVGVAKGQLGEALAKDAHGWISFAITFFIASVFWTFQHRLFELLEGVSQKMLVPTFVFLAFVSVLPFSTSLWGRHISEPLALLIYFGNQFAIAVALTVKLELAREFLLDEKRADFLSDHHNKSSAQPPQFTVLESYCNKHRGPKSVARREKQSKAHDSLES